jgi:hypothetical protein
MPDQVIRIVNMAKNCNPIPAWAHVANHTVHDCRQVAVGFGEKRIVITMQVGNWQSILSFINLMKLVFSLKHNDGLPHPGN